MQERGIWGSLSFDPLKVNVFETISQEKDFDTMHNICNSDECDSLP